MQAMPRSIQVGAHLMWTAERHREKRREKETKGQIKIYFIKVNKPFLKLQLKQVKSLNINKLSLKLNPLEVHL